MRDKTPTDFKALRDKVSPDDARRAIFPALRLVEQIAKSGHWIVNGEPFMDLCEALGVRYSPADRALVSRP